MKEMKVRLEGKARVRAPLTMRSMMIVFRNKITQTLCDKSLVYICTAIFNWTTNLKCYVHHQQISGNECQTKRFLESTPFILIPKYGQSNRRPCGLLSKISMPLLLASSLRTQTCIASLSPSGEKRRPEICHLLSVSAGYLRFLRHEKTKEGKQFAWMPSRLFTRVWFGGKGGGNVKLSLPNPLLTFLTVSLP